MFKTGVDTQSPSQRSEMNIVTDTEKECLEGIEMALDRMTRNTQLAPYFLTTPSDKPYRTPQAQQNNWCLSTPFSKEEENLQYATFLYRESQDSLFVLRTQHEDDTRQREKLLGMEMSKSHTRTPLQSQTLKKKISLSAYKQTRLNGQTSIGDSEVRPESRSRDITCRVVEQTATRPIYGDTEHTDFRRIAEKNSARAVAGQIKEATQSVSGKKAPEDSDSGASTSLTIEGQNHVHESPRKRPRLSSQSDRKEEVSPKRNLSRVQSQTSYTESSLATPKTLPTVQVEKSSPPLAFQKPGKSSSPNYQNAVSLSPRVNHVEIGENDSAAQPHTLPSWLPDLSESHTLAVGAFRSPKKLSSLLPPWAPHVSSNKARKCLPPVLNDSNSVASPAGTSPSAESHASSSQSEPLRCFSANSPISQTGGLSSLDSKNRFHGNSTVFSVAIKPEKLPPHLLPPESGQTNRVHPAANLSLIKQEQNSTIDKKDQTSKPPKSSAPNLRTVKVTSAPALPQEKVRLPHKSTSLVQVDIGFSKRADISNIVRLKYGKNLSGEVETIISQKKNFKPSKSLISSHQLSQSSSMDVYKNLCKHPLEDIIDDLESTPPKKNTANDVSILNSPKTPLLSLTKPPANATPLSARNKQAISMNSDVSSSLWSAHSDKMQKLGKGLKRTMQSFLKEANDPAATADMGRAKHAAIQGIESILCYIEAFTCLDQTRQTMSDPSATWKSLDPLASDVCYACHDFPHLRGFSLLLRSICCQMVLTGYTRVNPANLSQTATSLTELLRFHERASRLCSEADTHLSKKMLLKHYPSTYHVSQMLPLGMAARPMTIVRMGCAFLQEWTKRENLEWTQSLEEGICSELL